MKKTVVVTNLFKSIFLFLLFGVFNNLSSQITYLEKFYSDDLELTKVDTNSIRIYIFYEKDSNFRVTNRLLDYLDLIKVQGYDTTKFKITLISLRHVNICPPSKKFVLNGYKYLPGFFKYQPYLIYVSTNNSLYKKEFEKLSYLNKNTIKEVLNTEMLPSPFANFTNDIVFKIFMDPSDSLANQFNDFKANTVKSIRGLIQRNYYDSVYNLENHKFLYLTGDFSLMNFNQLKIDNEIKLSKYSSRGLNLGTTVFLKKLNNKFGYSLGLGYSGSNFELGINNSSGLIIDTVAKGVYDPNGDKFDKIGYGYMLVEKIQMSHFNLKFNLSYRKKISKKNDNFIMFSGGVIFNSVLTNSYTVQQGTITYGGYYPQYNKNDTMFNGFYEFQQNIAIGSEKRQVQTNSSYLSGNLSIDAIVSPIKSLPNTFFNFGILGIYTGNVLIKELNQNKLASNKDTYNSMLYRSNRLNYLFISFSLGLYYKL